MTRLNLLLTSIGLITLLACGGNSETKVVRDTTTLTSLVDSLPPAEAEKDKTNKDTLTTGNDTTKMPLLLEMLLDQYHNFNTSVGLEFLVGYSTTKYVQNKSSNNGMQVGLGLQVHLEKDK